MKNEDLINGIYSKLKLDLKNNAIANNILSDSISIYLKALTPEEALGKTRHDDYIIQKGKEKIIEASFRDSKGHAFSDKYAEGSLHVEELLTLDTSITKNRCLFISALNAIYKYLELIDKSIHCKNDEPVECAKSISKIIKPIEKVLVIGYQPRLIEELSKTNEIRVQDLDNDNIGKNKSNLLINGPDALKSNLVWCDTVLATGSVIVNGSIVDFYELNKKVVYYGVTISAAARILQLEQYCECGS